jgi:hypothetical protein
MGRTYSPVDMVTHSGAAWIAQNGMAAGVRPGDGATSWRLAIKRDTAALSRLVRLEIEKQLKKAPTCR